MTVPVIALACAEHRKRTASATCCLSTYWTDSPIACTFDAVRIVDGASAFARTPFGRSSAAMARISVTTPDFATAYADILATAPPGIAARDAKKTIEPRLARMKGINARAVR